jgi:RND family efflux transporter MFP subunit
MERVVTATGTLAPWEQSTLSAKVPGRLVRLTVDLGSAVHRGELLAQIDPRDYELREQQAAAALAQARAVLGLPLTNSIDQVDLDEVSSVKQARAVLEEASKNLDRIRRLSQSSIASVAELDTVEANYQVARMRYEAAREEARMRLATLAQRRAEHELALQQLADTRIVAPFDGVVQRRTAGLGEYVAVGTPILTLVQTDPLRLRLEVPERVAWMIATGQCVRLQVEGSTNYFVGRLTRISPVLTELNRMLVVEADVPRVGLLRPGLFARAQIIVAEQEQGLAVPLRSVVTFAGLEKVLAVRDGVVIETPITTARRGSDWVEVVSGLEPGAMVVLDPAGLRTGQPVSVIQPTDPVSQPNTTRATVSSAP